MGVSQAMIYPQTPQGGLFNPLVLNKSPLGDLGVDIEIGAYEEAPIYLFKQIRITFLLLQ
jgi:hypothetical protein